MSSHSPDVTSDLVRSFLSVPANQPKFFAKAAAGNADALILDLEDSVFPEQKLHARQTVIDALRGVDWGSKCVLVRVNALDTEWGFRDLVTIGAECPRLDGFMLPKLESPSDLVFVERVLDTLDLERAGGSKLQFHALIETARGIAQIERILEVARRLSSVTFGAGDYATSLGLYGQARSAGNADYVVLAGARGDAHRESHWNDSHHFAMSRVSNACHAFGITPVDGPYGDFSDIPAAEAATRRARALGYQAKWSIHPSLVDMINSAFHPTEAEVAWARRVAGALNEARMAGAGAAQLDGRLIEAATLKTVERILRAASDA